MRLLIADDEPYTEEGLKELMGEKVRIEIEDDGVGFPASADAPSPTSPSGGKERRGYGLSNVEKRLCLTFGVPRCISVESRPGAGTLVRVDFPARPAPSA